MEDLLRDYFPILVFLAIAGGVAIAMVAASFLVARQRPDTAKLSPYECGFEPFDDARIRFDVRYYLVAILFIIFDLEVAFLFPWAVSLGDLGVFGFWSMVVFLGRADHRLHLRMEEGGVGMGVIDTPARPIPPGDETGPAAQGSDRRKCRTGALSLRRSTTSSTGRGPGRCGR